MSLFNTSFMLSLSTNPSFHQTLNLIFFLKPVFLAFMCWALSHFIGFLFLITCNYLSTLSSTINGYGRRCLRLFSSPKNLYTKKIFLHIEMLYKTHLFKRIEGFVYCITMIYSDDIYIDMLEMTIINGIRND